MKTAISCIAAIAICLFVSCSRSSSYSADELKDATLTRTVPQDAADAATDSVATTEDIALQSGSQTYPDWDKKIIKTALIKLEVKDFGLFNTSIHSRLRTYGAYTAAEQQSQSNGLVQNNLTIKVPADQFDALLNSIGGEGITLISKEVSTDDVSTELVDTKARIEAKKQLRDKYADLLKDARNMKDILTLQSEINNLQQDIEAAAGRVNYLSHSAAYSTITINFFQYITTGDTPSEDPSFLTRLTEALAEGGAVVAHVFVFFASIWPLLLTGGALYVYLKRYKSKKTAV